VNPFFLAIRVFLFPLEFYHRRSPVLPRLFRLGSIQGNLGVRALFARWPSLDPWKLIELLTDSPSRHYALVVLRHCGLREGILRPEPAVYPMFDLPLLRLKRARTLTTLLLARTQCFFDVFRRATI